MAELKICTICDIPIDENYCSRCGQYYSSNKITTLTLIADFLSNFFSMEKSGFATIIKVLSNPKKVVDNYCSGYKNFFASPGKILIYGIAAVALHVYLVDEEVLGLSFQVENVGAKYLFWLLLFPFLFLASFLTFFKQKRNFSNHIISITYIATAVFVALIMINDLMILIEQDYLNIGAFFIYLFLVFYWNSRVFTIRPVFWKRLYNTLMQSIVFAAMIGAVEGIGWLVNKL